jgi:hypothetical protein
MPITPKNGVLIPCRNTEGVDLQLQKFIERELATLVDRAARCQ